MTKPTFNVVDGYAKEKVYSDCLALSKFHLSDPKKLSNTSAMTSKESINWREVNRLIRTSLSLYGQIIVRIDEGETLK